MPSKDPKLALYAIAENITLARQFLGVLSEAELAADTRTLYAVIRCLEIISEASRRLPEETRLRHPSVRWTDIASAGNIYRHEYEGIKVETIWETARSGLDELEPAIMAELRRT
jgi:uncharacterized protein with HEPN domain